MAKIEKTTLIADALGMGDSDKMAEVLMSYGMHCFGCALAHGETIEEAVSVHGADLEELLGKLNQIAEL